MSTRGSVTIVDDDAAVRDSLGLLLSLHGFAVRAFASGDAFLAVADAGWLGCVLLDLRMPGASGADVQRELAARGIAVPLIVLTAHGDATAARNALKAGAFDFLEKPVDERLLLATLDAAAIDAAARREISIRQAASRARIDRLTPRERDVLALVVAGRHNREIAAALGISPRTVEVYKARLMDKLAVDRLPELIRLALDAEFAVPPK